MTLTDPVSADLRRHLRTLKLGQLLHTLPERLTQARTGSMPHADFLELLLCDEVTRRENGSAARRARAAGLDPGMRLDTWDTTAPVRYDQQLWNELVTLRFTEAANGALIMGAVGTGKTHLATALGHIAVRRRLSVHMARADQMFKRLKAARLDNSTEAEHRRLAAVNILIIDDFALQPLDETATTDFYELTVARHGKNATIVTSNRTPDEWLALMHDQLLAQSAVDRLTSACHELIVDGPSYRQRQRPSRPRLDEP
jgi:DNA replication protein DnaC